MLKRFHRFIKKINRKQSFVSSAIDEIPLKRFGNPEEFAIADFYLASERASYITGVTLTVDEEWIKNIL